MRTVIVVLILTAFVAGCSKSSKENTPTYVSLEQYSEYDCEYIAKELMRVNDQANSLAGQLDEDAETDSAVTGVGLVLFWPALFFSRRDKGTRGHIRYSSRRTQCLGTGVNSEKMRLTRRRALKVKLLE